MSNLFGAKSEEEFLTSPFYAPIRQAMMDKKDVIERLAAKKQVGGPMPEDEANPTNTENADIDNEAVGALTSLGNLSAMDLRNPKKVSDAILANAAEQKRYYDELTEKIRQRRYGPSETEKLLALSAAFFRPTTVRGLSGTMGNVLPVLQKFGELRRTGEEERQEAENALVEKRLKLSQGNVTNALALQRLMNSYSPWSGAVYDTNQRKWIPRPNTPGAPPTLTLEQAEAMSKDPKNKGMKFYTPEGEERTII